MKNCERFTDLLSDYAEDGLASAEKRELDVHLQQCSECRSAAEGVVNLRYHLRQMPALKTSPDFEMILRTRIKMGRRAHAAPMWNFRHLAPRRVATLSAAVVAVVGLIYLWPSFFGPAFQPASPTIAVSQMQVSPSGILSSVSPAKIRYTLDQVTPQLWPNFGTSRQRSGKALAASPDSLRTGSSTRPATTPVASQPITF
jgi:anti-sigma factor RsiW